MSIKQRPAWMVALASLHVRAAVSVVKDYHAITIQKATDLPDGPAKDYAVKGVLAPEHVRRDKLGVEVSHTTTLDESVRRNLGELGRRRSPNTIEAGIAAIAARVQLEMSGWNIDMEWLKGKFEGMTADHQAARAYADAHRKARVDAAELLATAARQRAFGQTYGTAPGPGRVHGDQPYAEDRA